ncbi:M15 family metallopeptidase [Desulfogranum mediterraneum]|uniref:M15 family metallopeptidase n=1 Tax=Desulfogranum mediterraneum TaxID=160661 RepID=UPI000491283D|nr:M15 family metallopeptidase [Desulfogranum mediterraneum]
MSRELNDLSPEFRIQVEPLLESCQESGYPMRPFSTLRSPFEQARLWRQSRSSQQIERVIDELKDTHAPFLAHCLESVGPQNGRHVTNAIPGLSWHQWGEALDCFWLLEGDAEWSVRRKRAGQNGYLNYASRAQALGLTAGGLWSSFKDWPHIQLRPTSNPGMVFPLEQVDQEMAARFRT